MARKRLTAENFEKSKENPKGCEKGKLVQEELIKSGNAVVETYKDRGELRYEERLRTNL